MAELREQLEALAAKSKRLLAKEGQVGEENTKAVLVEPMLQALGWETHDLEEVQREYRYKSQGNPVDYALFVAGRPQLFVEAKGLGGDIANHKWQSQTVNYANVAGVEWCVLTDGNRWQIYKSNASGDLDQKLFLETWLHSPEGRTPPYEPEYALSMLGRDRLAANEMETLWQVLDVDRKGREALLQMIEQRDGSLLRLIRKRAGLTPKQAETFLRRAEVTIETPAVTVGANVPKSPTAPVRKKARARGVRGNAQSVGMPSQRELELPLLRAILRRGGAVNVRTEGHEVDEELAVQFGLTEEQRDRRFRNRPESVWSNRIRWTRMALVQKGDLDGSRRGIWRVTEQGRQRAERD
ncbi:MAG TPA: winged helix-turn-helix domain-containing protein [Anaerolineae bacterium]|nr:winged helix-turn-helix domain-containing protein [Anaerolineae bacterium]